MEVLCNSEGDCLAFVWGVPVILVWAVACAIVLLIIAKVWPED